METKGPFKFNEMQRSGRLFHSLAELFKLTVVFFFHVRDKPCGTHELQVHEVYSIVRARYFFQNTSTLHSREHLN